MESEANERIRRALRTKVRTAEQSYENGDFVFYKRGGKEKWLGPGKVVFQGGKVVIVRHGNVFVRVSPNRLCRISPEEGMNAGDSDIQEDVNEKAALRHTGTDSSKS